MSVVHLIVATRSSGPPASGKIIEEMPVSVASGTPYTIYKIIIIKLQRYGHYVHHKPDELQD